MADLLYLFGPAGCGKSRLMQGALGEPLARHDKPVPLLEYRGGLQIGRDRDSDGLPTAFPGVDRLGKSTLPAVSAFFRERADTDLQACAEGQWLAYHRFFDEVESYGWTVWPVYVRVAQEVLMERRLAREARLGRKVTSTKRSWWKTEDTRFERLWRTRMCPSVDNTVDASEVLGAHPVLRAIRGET